MFILVAWTDDKKKLACWSQVLTQQHLHFVHKERSRGHSLRWEQGVCQFPDCLFPPMSESKLVRFLLLFNLWHKSELLFTSVAVHENHHWFLFTLPGQRLPENTVERTHQNMSALKITLCKLNLNLELLNMCPYWERKQRPPSQSGNF